MLNTARGLVLRARNAKVGSSLARNEAGNVKLTPSDFTSKPALEEAGSGDVDIDGALGLDVAGDVAAGAVLHPASATVRSAVTYFARTIQGRRVPHIRCTIAHHRERMLGPNGSGGAAIRVSSR